MLKTLALISALVLSPLAVQAQGNACVDFEVGAQRLLDRYGEVMHGVGRAVSGSNFSMFVNDKTGTWTAMTIRNGKACMVASGENWYQLSPEEIARQSPGEEL